MAYESNVSQSSYSPGKLSINCNDKSILKWCFGPEHFTLDWKALCDLQYENIAEKPDEAMAFYIQQPIKNAQHAKIDPWLVMIAVCRINAELLSQC